MKKTDKKAVEKSIKLTEISTLQDGLYEKIMSQEFQDKLQASLDAQEIWTEQEDLDPQEAVPGLAAYFSLLLRNRLKELADRDDTDNAEEEIRFINDCIRHLFRSDRELGQALTVSLRKSLLLSLQHTKNQISREAARKSRPRPDTSLSRSFLFTNSRKDVNIASELRREILSSDRIDLLVSFIKYSGLRMILPELQQFTDRGGKLRIITTTYMGATDPKAVIQLYKLPHTEIRISYNTKETRLHAKAYMFYRSSGYSTAYIGSSNLSHAAIADGLEWNMKITAQDQPHILEKMRATFETYWNSADFSPFTSDQEKPLRDSIDAIRHPDTDRPSDYIFDIHPYPYQQTVLDTLQAERELKHCFRNLIVAATGTGKTAIAAFDYRRFAESRRPKTTHLLFLAHRKEILEQSRSCFRQVLKNLRFGELSDGEEHASHPEYLFMTVQTFSRQKFWERMAPDYYDMIIVDETHHAASDSYQKIFTAFHPKILLGLTATPERMDGKNILSYFDNHISAEIPLTDAIERRLLCPFHYFGTDDPVDLSSVSWKSGNYDTKELEIKYVYNHISAGRRAAAVLDALSRYTADLRDVKCIGFCVSKKHAEYMADYMNKHGIPSMNLDADTPSDIRKKAKEQLECGEKQILFTVDLFNEGVDIPSINTVLFLRPTNSLTVFLQQLGRGLRLSPGKDCLTVLDFVAQSNRNYNFARRFAGLLGSRSLRLQEEIKAGFPHAPKGCCIQLEPIAQKYVLQNIKSHMSRDEFYREQIRALYETAQAVPTLSCFLTALDIPAESFFNKNRLYTRLCADAGIREKFPVTEEESVLSAACPRILSIDSPRWIRFLQKELEHPYMPVAETEKQYLRMWQYTMYGRDFNQCGMESPLDVISRFAAQPALKEELLGILSYLYDRITILPKPLSVPYTCALEVHCRYTRDQIFAALGYNNPPQIREGVKYLPEKKTDVFLVTLNKSAREFSDTTLYEDYSINETLFHWQSQNSTAPESKTGQRYIRQKDEAGNDCTVLLFVRERKMDNYKRTMSYTFLGTAHYVSHTGSRPMTIIYKLDHPIPAQYLPATDSSGVL